MFFARGLFAGEGFGGGRFHGGDVDVAGGKDGGSGRRRWHFWGGRLWEVARRVWLAFEEKD